MVRCLIKSHNQRYYPSKVNDDAEGMCNSVASLEPDPRYSGCCSNIFRPGRVVRDIVVGALVVLGVAVVVAVVFVVCYFFIPAHPVPEASEYEVTLVPATHTEVEEGSLPPLFELFSPRTPVEEAAPEGSEGTLKELVVPHEHTHEEEVHAEPHPEVLPPVEETQGITEEVPQGKCQPRQLEMCSDLPHTLTGFPNWAGDQTEEDMQQTSLPFLRDVIVRSRCSPRAKEYSCAILEPPCTSDGTILPPCRTFCKSVAATCQEFITSRFSLSSAFDCEQFPDSSDPSVCFDLTQDSASEDNNATSVTPAPKEAVEVTEPILEETTTLPVESETVTPTPCPELQCLDGTCISLSQVNDGVVDCPEGIDEEDFGGLI